MAVKLSTIVQGMASEAEAKGLHVGGSPYTGAGSIEVEIDVDLNSQDKWNKSQVGPLKIKVDLKTFRTNQSCYLNIGVLKQDTTIKSENGDGILLKAGRLNFSLTNIREFKEAASVTEVLDTCVSMLKA